MVAWTGSLFESLISKTFCKSNETVGLFAKFPRKDVTRRIVVSRNEEFCRSRGRKKEEEGGGVLILITARSFAVQLEPSNWTLSWSRGDDGSVDKTEGTGRHGETAGRTSRTEAREGRGKKGGAER